MFCRRPAGFRVSGIENRGSSPAASGEHPGPWKRSKGTLPAVVEGDSICATRMAGSSGQKPCAGTIPQRSRHLHDPGWFRVHPAQTCLRGGEAMPIPFRPKESLRMSSATPVRLRFSRPPKICARSRSGSGTPSMQTTEIYTRADPSVKLEDAGVRHRAEVANRTIQGD